MMGTITEKFQYDRALLQWLNDLSDRGIFTTDASLKVVSWNHWLEVHSGVKATEAIGRNLLDLYPELKARRLDRFFYQAIAGQVAVLSQRLHGYLLPMRPTGVCKSLSNMLQSAKILPLIENGKVVGTIAAIEDVTERAIRESQLQRQIQELERTEAALRETQTRLQYLLSSSPAVIYTCQPQAKYSPTFVSDNASDRLGYPPHEFVESPNFWSSRIHPDDASHVFQELAELQTVGHQIIEYRFLHGDGNYRWLRDEMKLMCNPSGKVEEIVGALYDITERKRAEERVQEQAALLDIATDAILVKDLDNRILFWNKGAEKIYGWQAVEAIGQKCDRLVDRNSLSQVAAAIAAAIETGEWQGELEQVTKQGRSILVASRKAVVYDERHKPRAILAVNTDITEKKLLEAQFLRAQRMESIGTLASGIAHDLNNILTPILGAVQLLQFPESACKHDLLLEMLETNTLRGADLVKQVLSFAKGLDGERSLLQVKHSIDEIIAIARETFPKSIEFYTYIHPNLWLICADPTHIHQVLMNLCVNARDAMPEGGILSIVAQNVFLHETDLNLNLDACVGAYVKISVTDTGIGISPETLDRLFEPFFTTKAVGKGTGLGLSTVRGIVKSHGGFINVKSTLGKGSKFEIYLPAIEETEVRVNEAIELPRGRGELILIVDDETAICEIAHTLLDKFGYRVLTATNGIEAIAIYTQHQHEIDVVLLDMMMPSMDGQMTRKALEKIDPHVKIITITGLSAPNLPDGAKSAFPPPILSKPYTTVDLLKILWEVLQKE